jgi:prepilin-type N-terminal cleavage/methylation domain-containing protein
MSLKSKNGFSLVELMCVVAILGVLATIAMSRFAEFSIKAKQLEAKTNINFINTTVNSYYSENSSYHIGAVTIDNLSCSSNEYGISFYQCGTENMRYTYTIVGVAATATVQAIAPATSIFPGCTLTGPDAEGWVADNNEGRVINMINHFPLVSACSNY